MTDHHTGSPRDQAVSNRLKRHQHALDNALDGVLDIEAGLREVLIQSSHDTAVAQLATVLDTEAGLAAILPPAAAQSPKPVAPSTPEHAGAEELPLALSPAERMTLRNHPDVKTASHKHAHALDLDLASDLDLDLDFALDLALDLARGLASDLDLARGLDRARDLDLDRHRALALALASDLDLARARNRDLDRDLNLALDRARDLDLDLDLDLNIDLNIAFNIARDRARDLARALNRARALDRARNLNIAPDGALDRDLDHNVVIQICTKEVSRAIGLILRREPPVLGTDSVRTVLDDFTKADLRTTDLAGIDLSGVHWSEHTTQWPAAVDVEDLKHRSDETPPASGTWIVRSGTATIRDHATQR